MEITLPHRFEPRAYQLPLCKARDEGAKRMVAVWHRRGGKDKTALNITIKEAFKRVGTYYHIFPTYNQGRKIIWDGRDRDGMKFLEHFPDEVIKATNEQEMRIELVNGSAWQVIGSDKIDNIVGTNPIGCVFSEFSLQKKEAWDLIRPILAENGGWAMFLYTPRGMNHGFTVLEQAKQEKWFWEVLTVDTTKAIEAKTLEEERRQMPEDLYQQEYYCKFIEGASSFFKRVDQNIYQGDIGPEPYKVYQIGVDLAKYQDWTVITPFDLNTFQVGRPERFQHMDYTLQKARIEATYHRFNQAIVRVDSTGVGEPIYEDLMTRGITVDPYRFTERSRMDLLNNLSIQLAQDKIKIPDDEVLISELKSFQYQLTNEGKVKVGVPEGLHDDCVFSLALATWGVQEPLGRPNKEGQTTLPKFQKY